MLFIAVFLLKRKYHFFFNLKGTMSACSSVWLYEWCVFLTSFMSLSTHGNSHKPWPGLTALFSKSEDKEQSHRCQLQKKIKLRRKHAGSTLSQEKSDIEWANIFWVIVYLVLGILRLTNKCCRLNYTLGVDFWEERRKSEVDFVQLSWLILLKLPVFPMSFQGCRFGGKVLTVEHF